MSRGRHGAPTHDAGAASKGQPPRGSDGGRRDRIITDSPSDTVWIIPSLIMIPGIVWMLMTMISILEGSSPWIALSLANGSGLARTMLLTGMDPKTGYGVGTAVSCAFRLDVAWIILAAIITAITFRRHDEGVLAAFVWTASEPARGWHNVSRTLLRGIIRGTNMIFLLTMLGLAITTIAIQTVRTRVLAVLESVPTTIPTPIVTTSAPTGMLPRILSSLTPVTTASPESIAAARMNVKDRLVPLGLMGDVGTLTLAVTGVIILCILLWMLYAWWATLPMVLLALAGTPVLAGGIVASPVFTAVMIVAVIILAWIPAVLSSRMRADAPGASWTDVIGSFPVAPISREPVQVYDQYAD